MDSQQTTSCEVIGPCNFSTEILLFLVMLYVVTLTALIYEFLFSFKHHPFFCYFNIIISTTHNRNVLLEQLSRIQHAPSVQFQARPPDTELPEEVGHLASKLLEMLSGYASFCLY